MKQTRKIVVCLLLVGALSLLWGCGGQETSGMEESTTQATVSDIFTVPETDPTETDATQETEDPIKELLKEKFMMSIKVPGGFPLACMVGRERNTTPIMSTRGESCQYRYT